MLLVSGPESRTFRILAPAKLNLFLEIIARRADGYHEIITLMTAISLWDEISLRATLQPDILLRCLTPAGTSAAGIPQGEGNTVWRALDRLRQRFGIRWGAEVRVVKRIPSASGLGGASSDAAAALVAGAAAWQLTPQRSELMAVGADVGSDVAFFLGPGPAVCRGRGEIVDAVPGLPRLDVVVVRPPVGLSTPAVFGRCQPAKSPAAVEPLIEALRGQRRERFARLMVNRLQPAAAKATSWIDRMRGAFQRLDCPAHQMTGSGSSYFGICRHARHARHVAGALRASGEWNVFTASTVTAPPQGLWRANPL